MDKTDAILFQVEQYFYLWRQYNTQTEPQIFDGKHRRRRQRKTERGGVENEGLMDALRSPLRNKQMLKVETEEKGLKCERVQ